jgi:hypothetical protein
MFEDITLGIYAVVGFVSTYLALEMAWHFTACKIEDKSIKPCLFKQAKTILVPAS